MRFIRNVVLSLVCFGAAPAVLADFVRGDANRDGVVNVSDAVTQLLALFRRDVSLTCADAADANDDGVFDLADAQTTLLFLFSGRGEIPYPGAVRPGPDLSCDQLDCSDARVTTPAIVISEINYAPRGSDRRREFVELYNRTEIDIDVGGYSFSRGIDLKFPADTVVPAQSFLVVLAFPDAFRWPSLDAMKIGPYAGTLADGGERLTLMDGDCLVETVRYDDRPPWPIGADGYGPSLERIDYTAPADDFHSWRTSFRQTGPALGGTPGLPNTTLGTPTHPTIVSASLEPDQPRSSDSVFVTVELDAAPETLRMASLRWEVATDELSAVQSTVMQPLVGASTNSETTTLTATLPPVPSQRMVRFHLVVEMTSGETITLPHPADQGPFISYFVYDDEVSSELPILWLFPRLETGLIDEIRLGVSGAAAKELDDGFPQVFDGANVRRRMSTLNQNNGHNVTFLKNSEFRGDRTINLIPSQGGLSGPVEAHAEELALATFHDLGALAPWSEWFRVIDYTAADASERHVQRIVIEQVNRRFLALNGLDDGGDLFKLDRTAFQKRTNPHTGDTALNDFIRELTVDDAEQVRAAVLRGIDVENVCLYSTAVVLLGHWDTYTNNMFVYNDLTDGARWKVIPWDLDHTFRCVELPVTYPIEFTGPCVGRDSPTPLVRAHHLQPDFDRAFRDLLRHHISPGGEFSMAVMETKIASRQTLLLRDLELLEGFRGRELSERREAIVSSSDFLRNFVTARIAFLLAELDGE